MDQASVPQATGGDLQKHEVDHSALILADSLRVYNALTTSEGLDAWFTSGVKVNPSPGGQILFRWKNWGPDNLTAEDGDMVLEAI
jgi:uncharacterized protein YndB with AHSA1/START domain